MNLPTIETDGTFLQSLHSLELEPRRTLLFLYIILITTNSCMDTVFFFFVNMKTNLIKYRKKDDNMNILLNMIGI